MKDTFSIKGKLHIELFDKDGKLKDERKTHNAVTADGLAGVMDQCLASPSLPKAAWMELGTGNEVTTKKLETVIANSRHAVSPATARTGAVVTYLHTWAAGEATNAAITEAGLFDVVTADTANAWCYATFAAIAKGANDTLAITWTLTIS